MTAAEDFAAVRKFIGRFEMAVGYPAAALAFGRLADLLAATEAERDSLELQIGTVNSQIATVKAHLNGRCEHLAARAEAAEKERDEAVGDYKNLRLSADSAESYLQGRVDAAEAREKALRAPELALTEWDERWPDNRIHSATQFKRCHDELAEVVASFRSALAASFPEGE